MDKASAFALVHAIFKRSIAKIYLYKDCAHDAHFILMPCFFAKQFCRLSLISHVKMSPF